MEHFLDAVKFMHVIGFVFMSVPLFNLIVVNERAQFGAGLIYHADHYMENIIRRGATRCYVFQTTVLVSGVLLLLFGDLGFSALWTNWVLLAKTLLLFTLMGLLSYVHLSLQPRIDSILAEWNADSPPPGDLAARLKPLRVRRKQLATFCLFLVITSIILGLQVYITFSPVLTVALIVLAGLFARQASRTLVRFGWS